MSYLAGITGEFSFDDDEFFPEISELVGFDMEMWVSIFAGSIWNRLEVLYSVAGI